MTEELKVNVGTAGHIDHGKPSLSPCPFCGSEIITFFYEGSHDWVFSCKGKNGCGAIVNFYVAHGKDEQEKAIKAWNTRK
jgi:hypothetical protein